MRDTVTFVVIEFRGGPRDGERMVFKEGTVPTVVSVPMKRNMRATMEWATRPGLPEPIPEEMPVGVYEPETGPYEYDRLCIGHEVLMHSKCDPADLVLVTFHYKRLRPIMWKWCGER